MEKGYTPGCVSVVFVLAIGFFIGKANTGSNDQVESRLNSLQSSVNEIKEALNRGVVFQQGSSSQNSQMSSSSKEEDYEETLKAQKAYQHIEPDWDQGADSSISADLGGKGFTGTGWETNKNYNYVGDPRAIRGGQLTLRMTSFPVTFRPVGAKSNTSSLRVITNLMYESLLTRDPRTLDWTPLLATHWKSEQDGKVFVFRLNPSVRWSDGKPLIAEDVVASHRLLTDPGIESPGVNAAYERLVKVEALSKYIVKFTCEDNSWRNFDLCAGIGVYPSHVLENLDGAQFLDKFQFKFMPGTGPYLYEKHKEGSYIQLKRRTNYWGEKHRSNIGQYNFETLKFIILADAGTTFEALKKGEIDISQIGTSQRWVEQTSDGKFARGIIQKRRIFNKNPTGTSGFGFNMRKPPFNDRNIRMAFSHLIDFKTMNEKFFFGQYFHMDSYFDNGRYEYKNKKEIYRYDPRKAREYLAKSGWTELNSEGYLEKDGEIFSIDLPINAASPAFERIMVKVQEDAKAVGIKLNLQKKAPMELWKLQNDRQFSMIGFGWTQSLYPMPEQSWHSKNASQPNTINLYGVAEPKLDTLIDDYEAEPNPQKRVVLLQEIDRILYEEIVPAALWWYGPYVRFVYHDYLDHPSYYLGPYSSGDVSSVVALWWRNPEKQKAYDQAVKGGGKLPVRETEVEYWLKQDLN